MMELVKIKDIKTGAIMAVKKTLAGDYIGTGRFALYEEKPIPKKQVEEKSIEKETNAEYKF